MSEPRLPKSAQVVLARVAAMLSEGFSGEIVLDCAQGGIRTMRAGQVFRPNELEDAPKRVA